MRSRVLRHLMGRYGQSVEVAPQGAPPRTVNALIQPLRYRSRRYFDGDFLPGGTLDSRHFLYIGPADVRIDLMRGTVLVERTPDKYVVRRSEAVFLSNECIYVWAVLQPYVEEESA